MNLEESDKFVKENEARLRKRKWILISIILCAVLIAFLFVIILFIKYEDARTLKMYIDGERTTISSNLLMPSEDTTYVNIKEMAQKLGLVYTKGSYEELTEAADECYITTDHEVICLAANSNTFTKYILNSEELSNDKKELEEKKFGVELTVRSTGNTKEVFSSEKPIIQSEGNLYMPFDLMVDVFNVQVDVENQYRIRIYTLAKLYENAKKIAGKLGYSNITGEYENIRGLAYGYIVVGLDGKYGVIDGNGQELISIKYDELEFVQNVEEFFVFVNGNIGLLSEKGDTIIKPTEYDDISVYDAEKQLYLVEKNNKYGILNREGKIIIHAEYDQIGLEATKELTEDSNRFDILENKLILFDSYIPVKQNSKYGLYDLNGKEAAKTVYDDIGYFVNEKVDSTQTTNVGETSTILIPESNGIKGIILNQNGGFGIFDAQVGNLIIPTVCSKIYSITKNGVTTYYMEFNGMELEVASYMKQNNLVSVKEDKDADSNLQEETNQTNAETTTENQIESQKEDESNEETQNNNSPEEQP